MFSDLCRNEK